MNEVETELTAMSPDSLYCTALCDAYWIVFTNCETTGYP